MVSPPLHPVGQESLEEGCAGARQRAMGAQAVPVMPAPPQVAEILGAILAQLPVVDHREARRPLIEGILLLAHYHQETVLTALLRQPLPMERWVPWTGSHSPLCGPDQAPLTATDVSWRTGRSSSTGSEAGLGQTLSLHPRGRYSLGARGNHGPRASVSQFRPLELESGSRSFSRVLVIPPGLRPRQPFHSLQRTELWAPSKFGLPWDTPEDAVTKAPGQAPLCPSLLPNAALRGGVRVPLRGPPVKAARPPASWGYLQTAESPSLCHHVTQAASRISPDWGNGFGMVPGLTGEGTERGGQLSPDQPRLQSQGQP